MINWRRFIGNVRVFVLGVVSSLLARRLIFPHLLFHRLYRVASDYKLANRGGSSGRRWKRLSANLLVGCVISWRNLRRYAVSRFQGSRTVERCRGGREYARRRFARKFVVARGMPGNSLCAAMKIFLANRRFVFFVRERIHSECRVLSFFLVFTIF